MKEREEEKLEEEERKEEIGEGYTGGAIFFRCLVSCTGRWLYGSLLF